MDSTVKDQILQATDIVALIGERITLSRKGREFVGLCPFHADHKPSLSVSPAKQIFKCFACGAGGDAIEFVHRIDHLEWRDALASLAERAGISLRSSPADRQAAQRRTEMLDALAWAKLHFLSNFRAARGAGAREYARERGLSAETLERFEIGLAVDAWDDLFAAARQRGLSEGLLLELGLLAQSETQRVFDRFRNRLIFPISDGQGRTIAFGGRTLGDDPAKYLNSRESAAFSKSRVLYGLHAARRAIEQAGAAIVVEGYMDCVMLHQHGLAKTIAPLGTALTDAQVQLIAPFAPTIYLCFDGDTAGALAADRAVEIALRGATDVRVVQLQGVKDPADCVVAGGAAAFQAFLDQSVDALEFKWRQMLTRFGGGQQARRRALEGYLAFVAEASRGGSFDPLTQNLIVGRLADVLGAPAESVHDMLARQRRLRLRGTAAPAAAAAAAADTASAAADSPPAKLAGAVETVLGLLSSSSACWAWVDDVVLAGVQYYPPWDSLYHLIVDVHEDLGEYSVTDIVARSDDRALLGLLSRARERVSDRASLREQFEVARKSLAVELNSLKIMELREFPRSDPQAEEEAFNALRSLARERHAVLPAYDRWSASADTPS